MDIEDPGDVADRFPFFNEISSEGALVRAQFGRAAEGDAACLSGAPSFLGSGGDQRAFERRDACEHGVSTMRPAGVVVSAQGSAMDWVVE